MSQQICNMMLHWCGMWLGIEQGGETRSSLSPINFVCLNWSAPVHSRNSIPVTVSARSQTHSFIFSAVSP
jgi:hypothetical protein